MRSYHLFVNPASGGGRAAARGVAAARLLRDAGASVALTYSPGLVECRRLAADAVARGEVVVAVGGDGMLSSVAASVVDGGGALGVVPAGRGNDFARQLGVPTGVESLVELLLMSEGRAVDVIDVDGRVVLGSVYAGIDSRASQIVDRSQWLPRSVQYPYASVRSILEHRPTRYVVTLDGSAQELDAYTVIVANSGFYGSGMHIAPAATVDDGLLDVVVITAISRARLLRALSSVYAGRHVEQAGVLVMTGREVGVSAVAPVTAYGDGELLGSLPVTARVRPRVLTVLA